jgi:hypothetical protein
MTASPSPSIMTTRDIRVRSILRNRERRRLEQTEQLYYQASPYNPAHAVLPDGAWQNERCFIIGGGPSLSGFDFNRLKDKGKIIATNKSFYDCMFADICYFMDGSDSSFYGFVTGGKLGPDYKRKWSEFKGLKIYLNIPGRKIDKEKVYSIRSLGMVGLSRSLKKGMYHGNNSGTGALYLAIILKANPIYLLGMDGRFTKGKSHYHEGYPSKHKENVYKTFVRQFEHVSKFMVNSRIKIYNCNFNSAVRCFPFKSIEEALR